MNSPNNAASEKMTPGQEMIMALQKAGEEYVVDVLCGGLTHRQRELVAQTAILASRTNNAAQPSSAAQVEGIDLTQIEGHTPGPLLYSKNYAAIVGKINHRECHIATVHCPSGFKDRDANGELFRRAPELVLEIKRLTASLAHERAVRKGLVEALRANGVFHTPLALRKNGKPWDEYQIDAINRTNAALAATDKGRDEQRKCISLESVKARRTCIRIGANRRDDLSF